MRCLSTSTAHNTTDVASSHVIHAAAHSLHTTSQRTALLHSPRLPPSPPHTHKHTYACTASNGDSGRIQHTHTNTNTHAACRRRWWVPFSPQPIKLVKLPYPARLPHLLCDTLTQCVWLPLTSSPGDVAARLLGGEGCSLTPCMKLSLARRGRERHSLTPFPCGETARSAGKGAPVRRQSRHLGLGRHGSPTSCTGARRSL